jgi:hypothetical protein
MLVQKKEVLQGEWAKINRDIFNGDIITIIDEGKIVSGTYRERYVFKIKTKTGDIKLLTFNQTSINYLIDAYGNETEKWKGKEAKVWIVKSSVGGKMRDVVYLTPPEATL